MPDKKFKLRGNDPRLNEPKKRPHHRLLHIRGQVWQWRTNGHDIYIYDPTRKRHHIRCWDLEGQTEEEFWWNRDYYEFGFSIFPHDIRSYIIAKLLPSE